MRGGERNNRENGRREGWVACENANALNEIDRNETKKRETTRMLEEERGRDQAREWDPTY